MTWFLNRAGEEKAPLNTPIPATIDQFMGAIRQQYLAQDSWGMRSQYAAELETEVINALGGWEAVYPKSVEEVQSFVRSPEGRRDRITSLVAQARQFDPGAFAQLPGSLDEFDAEVKRRYGRDQAETDAMLARGDAKVTQFAGAMAGAISDEYSLPLLVLGGSGSIARVVAMEAGLGAAGEIPSVIKQNVVRDWQGKDPLTGGEVAAQIGLGAAAGGVLGGAIATAPRAIDAARGVVPSARKAAPRILDYAKTRVRGEGQIRPEDMAGDDYAGSVTAAEKALRTGAGFTQVLEAGRGFTTVRDASGRALRREGTRAWRNNNPGNIEYGSFAKSHGAVGTDGRFAVFPSYEAGRKAKEALLFESKGYRGKTLRQAINRYAPPVENDTGAYVAAVARGAGVAPDTPLSAMTAKQRQLMLDAMERVEGFRPGRENGVQMDGPARTAPADGDDGALPSGPSDAPLPGAFGSASRRTTMPDEIVTPAGTRIPVEYRVVDLNDLTSASGDLQPRDRSRAASDDQIAEMAARLDPARLMPSVESDRGTPLVGPDMIIESGNGRIAALRRAAETNPEAYAAYRREIEGFTEIPEGIERPVLVAVRRGEIPHEERVRIVRESNMSGIAQMSAKERAKFNSDFLDQRTFDVYQPGRRINAPENTPFTRRFLAGMTNEERGPFLTGPGLISYQGIGQIKGALFARAFEADDLLTLYAETESEALLSVIRMLEDLAPDWAYFRAMVEAGYVRPEFDVTPQLLDVVRIIAKARAGGRDGQSVISAVRDALSQGDMFAEADPITEAMLGVFYRGNRARGASASEEILRRYAAEATQVGRADIDDVLGDAVQPIDALRAAIDGYDGKSPFEPMTARNAAPEPQDGPVEPLGDISGLDPSELSKGTESAAVQRADDALEDDLRGAASPEDVGLADDIAALAEARAAVETAPDMAIRLSADPNAPAVTMREVLDDLEADQKLIERMSFCNLGGRA